MNYRVQRPDSICVELNEPHPLPHPLPASSPVGVLSELSASVFGRDQFWLVIDCKGGGREGRREEDGTVMIIFGRWIHWFERDKSERRRRRRGRNHLSKLHQQTATINVAILSSIKADALAQTISRNRFLIETALTLEFQPEATPIKSSLPPSLSPPPFLTLLSLPSPPLSLGGGGSWWGIFQNPTRLQIGMGSGRMWWWRRCSASSESSESASYLPGKLPRILFQFGKILGKFPKILVPDSRVLLSCCVFIVLIYYEIPKDPEDPWSGESWSDPE